MTNCSSVFTTTCRGEWAVQICRSATADLTDRAVCRAGSVCHRPKNGTSMETFTWDLLHVSYMGSMSLSRLRWLFWPTIVHQQQVWGSRVETCDYWELLNARSTSSSEGIGIQTSCVQLVFVDCTQILRHGEKAHPSYLGLRTQACGVRRASACSSGLELDSEASHAEECPSLWMLSWNPARLKAVSTSKPWSR